MTAASSTRSHTRTRDRFGLLPGSNALARCRRGTLALALATARPAGRVVQVGLAGGIAEVTALKTVKPEVSVSVSWWGNIRELREVNALVESGRLTPIPLEFWPLSKINDVYDRVKRGEVAGRAVLTP